MGIVQRKSSRVTILMLSGVVLAYVNIAVLFPKFLSPEEIGTLRQIVSGPTIILPLFLLGLNSSVLKFFPKIKDDKKLFQDFFGFIVVIPLIMTGIIAILFAIFNDQAVEILGFKNQARAYAWMIVPLILVLGFNNLFTILLNNLLKVELTSFFGNIWFRVMQFLIVILFYFDFVTFSQVAISTLLIYGLQLIVLIWSFLKETGLKLVPSFKFYHSDLFKETVVYSLFSALNSGAGYIVQNVDIIMTSYILGLKSTGIYTTAFFIAVLIEFPKRAVGLTIAPLLSDDFKNNKIEELRKKNNQASIVQFILGGTLFLLLWINSDSLFEIMPNGEKFQLGKYVILFVGLGKLYEMVWGLSGELLNLSKYYRWASVLMVLLVFLAFSTNLIFIPKYGIVGTAFATFVSIFCVNSLRGLIIFVKLKIQPFRLNHLKVLFFFLIVLTANYYFEGISSPLLEIVLRTVSVVVLMLLPIYFLKISPDINKMVDKYIRFVIKKK